MGVCELQQQACKMKLLVLLVLLCCFVVIQSNPVHTQWKQVVQQWMGKEVNRVRRGLDDKKEGKADNGDDNNDDDDDDDDDDDGDDDDHGNDGYDEDECYFTDKCNYYNDDIDPCSLSPEDCDM